MSPKRHLDLTLYLVTDENPDYLKGKELVWTVEEAIQGGVTIVQYRQKHGSPTSRADMASKLLEITRKYHVPLVINDDIDTCLAVGADGLHIGQDDMKLKEAREKLGESAIIGVTASSIEEAEEALAGGADYLGISTTFVTPTKSDTKSVIGTRGTQAILNVCKTGTAHQIPCVAIGGINSKNIQRVLHQSSTHSGNYLNGIAVVSSIVAAKDPRTAARNLRSLMSTNPATFYVSTPPGTEPIKDLGSVFPKAAQLILQHSSSGTLSHNMTNTVVQNFAANVCLATGASPIMSLNGFEADDLAVLHGGLVINLGTITPNVMTACQLGLLAYNGQGNPVVLDPVGGGATTVRKEAIKTLMQAGFFDVIKGNESEIMAVIGTTDAKQHGVDSGPSSSTRQQKIDWVTQLARRERCIVLMTGATDYFSDGTRTYAISNGSHWLGRITGSGCALGSVIASYVAMYKEDKFLAALAGILHYEIAAELAEEQIQTVRGPGSFIPAFLDELYRFPDSIRDTDGKWVEKRAKVEDVSSPA